MIGKRIKALRKEKDLLQKELANKLNLSQQTISLYESGQREPDYETLNMIAKFFNVSTDYLLGNSDIRNPYKEDYPESSKLINHIRKIAEENGYDITDKSDEEIAKLTLIGLKVEEINKDN